MRLPETLSRELFDLMDRLLMVIDLATVTEQALFELHGENPATVRNLDELTMLREDHRESYRRLSQLLLVISSTLPESATDAVRRLRQTAVLSSEQVDAALLSIEQVKRTWRLP